MVTAERQRRADEVEVVRERLLGEQHGQQQAQAHPQGQRGGAGTGAPGHQGRDQEAQDQRRPGDEPGREGPDTSSRPGGACASSRKGSDGTPPDHGAARIRPAHARNGTTTARAVAAATHGPTSGRGRAPAPARSGAAATRYCFEATAAPARYRSQPRAPQRSIDHTVSARSSPSSSSDPVGVDDHAQTARARGGTGIARPVHRYRPRCRIDAGGGEQASRWTTGPRRATGPAMSGRVVGEVGTVEDRPPSAHRAHRRGGCRSASKTSRERRPSRVHAREEGSRYPRPRKPARSMICRCTSKSTRSSTVWIASRAAKPRSRHPRATQEREAPRSRGRAGRSGPSRPPSAEW